MTRFMRKTRGLRPVLRAALRNWQTTVEQISKTPSEIYDLIHSLNQSHRLQKAFLPAPPPAPAQNPKRSWLLGFALALSLTAVIGLYYQHEDLSAWQWTNILGALGAWALAFMTQ
jgi:hypothetical protein